jgi:hypothetical protein
LKKKNKMEIKLSECAYLAWDWWYDVEETRGEKEIDWDRRIWKEKVEFDFTGK